MKHTILLLTIILFAFIANGQTTDELNQLFENKNYKEAIEVGLKLIEQNSNDYYTNMIIGRSYTNINQYTTAIPYLEKGANPSNKDIEIQAWSHAYLGTCYFAMDDYQKAKKALRRCVELNAPIDVNSSCEIKLSLFQMDEFYDTWEMKETEHIRFHFQNINEIKDVDSYVNEREQHYIELNKFFKATPFKKIDFFVWNNIKEAKERLGRAPGFASYGNCIINVEKRQSSGYVLTNILLVYGIKPGKTTQLINEGIAMYFEQKDKDKMSIAQNILKGKSIQVKELWENPVNYPKFYINAVGGALIEYLLNNGTEEQLKNLLKNQTIDSAKEIYPDFDSLLEEFESMLKK